MARVRIVASDPEVVLGLQRMFARHRGVEIVRVEPGPETAEVHGPPAAGPVRPVHAVASVGTPGGAPTDAETSGAALAPTPDLLILDIWPATPNAAEPACTATHARYPDAAIVAVVHETIRRLGAPPTGHGLLGLVISERRPLRVDEIAAHPHSVGFPSEHPPMKALLAVPLLFQNSGTAASTSPTARTAARSKRKTRCCSSTTTTWCARACAPCFAAPRTSRS